MRPNTWANMAVPKPNRREFLSAIGTAAIATTFPGYMGKQIGRNTSMQRVGKKPNIVLILADDMGYGDLACQNPESKIPTPHLDQVAKEGIRFVDAHSPSAVCTPTRYGLLTGRYCWRTRLKRGVLWCWDKPLVEPERLTLGKLMKMHGYDTACIGKWHLGWDWPTIDGQPPMGMGKTTGDDSGANVDFTKPILNGPMTRGFDYYFGTAVPNFPPYCFIKNDRTVGIPTIPKPNSMFGCPGPMLEGWKLEGILPALKNRAVEYINAKGGQPQNEAFNQTAGQPFFLYIPLTAPHTPIAPTKEFQGKSQAGAYGDFVYQIDNLVGAVSQALEQNGFADDTLIIFTSDNGSPGRDGANMCGEVNAVRKYGHNPSYIYRGIKADIWDGGHRMPFVARWPEQIPAGTTSDEIICLVDFMATFANILGADLPMDAGEDSYNILPALMGEAMERAIREAVVHHSGNGMFSIRQGKWKLILGKGSGGWSGSGEPHDPPGQLYNMEVDSPESRNFYNEHPEIVERLTNLLEHYKQAGRSAPRR